MKPMLAHRYQDKGHKLPPTFHVQPKINGFRALCQRGVFQSRDEITWHEDKLRHLSIFMETMPQHIVFDGELYLHGASLQQINSAVSVKSKTPTNMTDKIEYWVFDMFDKINPLMPFAERHAHLKFLLGNIGSPIVVCPTFCTNRQGAERFYAKALEQKFEGIMYRVSDAPYGLAVNCGNKENRWNYLLKRKDSIDAVVKVVGMVAGEGKYSEAMGALVCEYENGRTFHVGTGFSDPERFRYYLAPPIGERIKISFFMLSDEGVPTQAVFEHFVD